MAQDVTPIHPSLIEWEQSRQFEERSASFGDPLSQFPPSFAERGWDAAEGAVKVHTLTTKKEADALIKERKERIAEWKERGDEQTILYTSYGQGETQDEYVHTTYGELAEFAEELWINDDGNWIRPQYRGIVCYRRGYAMPASLYAFQSYNDTNDVFQIPVVPTEFGTDDEEFLERLRENEQRGRVGYGLADQLAIASRLVKIGKRESEVQDLLNVKHGQAQKLHSWASVHRKFSKLDLVNRARLPHPVDENGKLARNPIPYQEGGFYPLSSVTAKQARTLLGRSKSIESMDEMAVEAMGHKEPGRAATQQQVEKFLRILCEGRKNAPKTMDKSTIGTFAQWAPMVELADIFNGILENDGVKVSNAIEAIAEKAGEAEAEQTEAEQTEAEQAA